MDNQTIADVFRGGSQSQMKRLYLHAIYMTENVENLFTWKAIQFGKIHCSLNSWYLNLGWVTKWERKKWLWGVIFFSDFLQTLTDCAKTERVPCDRVQQLQTNFVTNNRLSFLHFCDKIQANGGWSWQEINPLPFPRALSFSFLLCLSVAPIHRCPNHPLHPHPVSKALIWPEWIPQ